MGWISSLLLLKIFLIHYNFLYLGSREDIDADDWMARVNLPSYTKHSIGLAYNLKKNINFLGNIENVFNHPYNEIHGIKPLGRVFSLTFKYRI